MMMEIMEALMSVWFLMADNGLVGGLVTMLIGAVTMWIFMKSREDLAVVETKVTMTTGTQTARCEITTSTTSAVSFPERIVTTQTGSCHHVPTCGHVRSKPTSTYRRCLDCLGR